MLHIPGALAAKPGLKQSRKADPQSAELLRKDTGCTNSGQRKDIIGHDSALREPLQPRRLGHLHVGAVTTADFHGCVHSDKEFTQVALATLPS